MAGLFISLCLRIFRKQNDTRNSEESQQKHRIGYGTSNEPNEPVMDDDGFIVPLPKEDKKEPGHAKVRESYHHQERSHHR